MLTWERFFTPIKKRSDYLFFSKSTQISVNDEYIVYKKYFGCFEIILNVFMIVEASFDDLWGKMDSVGTSNYVKMTILALQRAKMVIFAHLEVPIESILPHISSKVASKIIKTFKIISKQPKYLLYTIYSSFRSIWVDLEKKR